MFFAFAASERFWGASRARRHQIFQGHNRPSVSTFLIVSTLTVGSAQGSAPASQFWNGALIATIVISLVVVVPLGWGKERYRQVLISANQNTNVDPFLFRRNMIVSRYATPDCPTPWSVRKFCYFGGKREQVDVVWIDNGKLQIAVIPTRGMGILWVLIDGKRVLGWDSPVKDIVHPNFINLNSRGGLG